MVVKSEPEIFNPFLRAFFFSLTGCVSQHFLYQQHQWHQCAAEWDERGGFDLITFLGKAVPPILNQSDGLRHLVTLKIIFCSQNWRILILAEQLKEFYLKTEAKWSLRCLPTLTVLWFSAPIKNKRRIFFAMDYLVPKLLAWKSNKINRTLTNIKWKANHGIYFHPWDGAAFVLLGSFWQLLGFSSTRMNHFN